VYLFCPKGVIYMSPFWNHILAKKGRFIHVRSQISWYVCSMYLGTKGDFFSYTCTFCALLPRCCVLLCESFFLRMYCTIVLFPTYVLYNFLILQILCWSTLHAYFWPSAVSPPESVQLQASFNHTP
jgi:hypothetical protein